MKRDFLVIYIPIYLKMFSIMRDDVCIAQRLSLLMRWKTCSRLRGAREHDVNALFSVLDVRRL